MNWHSLSAVATPRSRHLIRAVLCLSAACAAGAPLISEYGEGSGNNKYVEVYNPGPEALDLAAWQLVIARDGGGWEAGDTIELAGALAAGAVFTVCHPGAAPALLVRADLLHGSLSFNGNDALGLFLVQGEGRAVVDAVGCATEDPGSGWAVAGIEAATLDHTLVRRDEAAATTDWPLSAGTDTAGSQWAVYPADSWGSAGFHGQPAAQPPRLDLYPPGTNRYGSAGHPVSFSVVAADFNRDTVTLSAAGLPAGSTFGANPLVGAPPLAPVFTWTPATAGSVTLTFTASDRDGACSLPVALHIAGPLPPACRVWINEFHYDNAGTDSNEGIELAGVAGTDLSAFRLVRYNGSGGTVCGTDLLDGLYLDNEGGGFGAVWVGCPLNGLQNDGPDGMALVEVSGGLTNVIQFLGYEGVFTATEGPAAGLTCTDVGVMEAGTEAAGLSLQLAGSGSAAADFTWSGPLPASPGRLNDGQVFYLQGSWFVVR